MYLGQVRHQVLAQRANQHVQGPLAFLGEGGRLQRGFLSVDYCRVRGSEVIRGPLDQRRALLASGVTAIVSAYVLLAKSP